MTVSSPNCSCTTDFLTRNFTVIRFSQASNHCAFLHGFPAGANCAAPAGFFAIFYALRHGLGYGHGETLGSIVTRKTSHSWEAFLIRTNMDAANSERSI